MFPEKRAPKRVLGEFPVWEKFPIGNFVPRAPRVPDAKRQIGPNFPGPNPGWNLVTGAPIKEKFCPRGPCKILYFQPHPEGEFFGLLTCLKRGNLCAHLETPAVPPPILYTRMG